MTRDQMIESVKRALTSVRWDEKGLVRSKIAIVIEDRIPGGKVTFTDSPDMDVNVTGSVTVEGIDPVQFRILKND